MNEERTALDTLYFVNNSNRKVSLEIITGGVGQTSTISVRMEGMPDIDQSGYLPPTIIGDNKELIGKVLIVACTVTDTSRDSNFTELRIRLSGGLLFLEYPLFAEVKNEGDSVSYLCIIRFFNP